MAIIWSQYIFRNLGIFLTRLNLNPRSIAKTSIREMSKKVNVNRVMLKLLS